MNFDKSKLKSSVKNIKFTAPSQFFGEEGEEIIKIPLDQLIDFPNHPFHVTENDSMQALQDSIEAHGVATPILVRPAGQHQYEIIAGHRRTMASRLLGLEEIPAIVRELDHEEAVFFMVDTNIQREELLPSEKAFAYKMKLEALRNKAGRSKKRGDQLDHPKKSRDILAESSKDSGPQIQRYIRLTHLCPTLLQWTDEKKIPFMAAVDLSYLSMEEQTLLLLSLDKRSCSVNMAQAKALKESSLTAPLDQPRIAAILEPSSKQKTKQSLRVDAKKYFPPNTSKGEMEKIIDSLLAQWYQEEHG